MTDLYFQNEEQLNNVIKNLQFIGIGSEGCCYRLSKDVAFKHLSGPAYEKKNAEEILQFKDINISNYVFVQNLVYIKDEIVGVLMRYINGKSVEDKLYQVQILNLIKAFDDLISATKKLSDLGISVFDVCPVNMLYNKGKFYLIDTMDYQRKDIDSNIIFKDNMTMITANIYHAILPFPVLNFLNSIPEIKDFRKDKELLSNPSYVMRILLNNLNEYLGYEVKSFEEASKKLVKN